MPLFRDRVKLELGVKAEAQAALSANRAAHVNFMLKIIPLQSLVSKFVVTLFVMSNLPA